MTKMVVIEEAWLIERILSIFSIFMLNIYHINILRKCGRNYLNSVQLINERRPDGKRRMSTPWHHGYGAIPRTTQSYDSDEYTNSLPGPENVKTFPDRWRKASLWIVIFIVLHSHIIL